MCVRTANKNTNLCTGIDLCNIERSWHVVVTPRILTAIPY
jgi:hypothetical protein